MEKSIDKNERIDIDNIVRRIEMWLSNGLTIDDLEDWEVNFMDSFSPGWRDYLDLTSCRRLPDNTYSQ